MAGWGAATGEAAEWSGGDWSDTGGDFGADFGGGFSGGGDEDGGWSGGDGGGGGAGTADLGSGSVHDPLVIDSPPAAPAPRTAVKMGAVDSVTVLVTTGTTLHMPFRLRARTPSSRAARRPTSAPT